MRGVECQRCAVFEAKTTKVNMDKRMGLCIDIGHTKRINRNPEQDLTDFFDRVFDVHIKDVTADGDTCIIGRGVINFPVFINVLNQFFH